MMEGIHFGAPYFLWLLILIPAILFYHFYYFKKKDPQFRFSSLNEIRQ